MMGPGDGQGWYYVKVDCGMRSCYSRCHKGPLVWCSSCRLLRMSTLYSVAGSSSVLIVQLWSTILPANLCTLSSLVMSCFWWGSCTAEQYSSLGRIVVWTIFWRTSTGAWWSCWWITVFWLCLRWLQDTWWMVFAFIFKDCYAVSVKDPTSECIWMKSRIKKSIPYQTEKSYIWLDEHLTEQELGERWTSAQHRHP